MLLSGFVTTSFAISMIKTTLIQLFGCDGVGIVRAKRSDLKGMLSKPQRERDLSLLNSTESYSLGKY